MVYKFTKKTIDVKFDLKIYLLTIFEKQTLVEEIQFNEVSHMKIL